MQIESDRTAGRRRRGLPGRLFALLACVATSAAAAATRTSALPVHSAFELRSHALGEVRRINVYLPPGYADGSARYPVLYMPDGGLDEDFPHVVRDVDQAIRSRQMRPTIVIGIANTERRRDMTGPTRVAADRKIAPHVGGSAAFRRFIADELMPAVRRRYRTDGDDALIGESLAGLFVTETFLLRPRLFDTYIALSPSLWWNAGRLLELAPARLQAMHGVHARFYFATSGDDDIDHAGERLQAILRDDAPAGVRWRYVPRPDLRHATIYRGASPGVFRLLFPPRPTAYP